MRGVEFAISAMPAAGVEAGAGLVHAATTVELSKTTTKTV